MYFLIQAFPDLYQVALRASGNTRLRLFLPRPAKSPPFFADLVRNPLTPLEDAYLAVDGQESISSPGTLQASLLQPLSLSPAINLKNKHRC